ncbi:hypothetical protein AGLY_007860 [Aphis glycines]|uniref:Transmembrane protein n=1 Tax=Aphis glycines TaxID=307491 RepID=A0A6G0TNA1_APHGL|nr:hypothetical protein AGLY_007860 [Aphis glycines]
MSVISVYMSIKNFWSTKNSNFYEICRKRENLQTTEIFNFSEKFFLKCRLNFFGPIKILEHFIRISSYVILIHLKFKFRQKFVKIMNICKLFCSSKFIKLFVFISNVKYSRLTNHLRSESFFYYNHYFCIKIILNINKVFEIKHHKICRNSSLLVYLVYYTVHLIHILSHINVLNIILQKYTIQNNLSINQLGFLIYS